ncbi:MAG TPA: HlyD family type I secretion periplasmic adaptor subunit [Burkholderiales bacterium]|nr:HlyD family type I secretion periplasmic adaptor subunit [Burkholderiales bacterium]
MSETIEQAPSAARPAEARAPAAAPAAPEARTTIAGWAADKIRAEDVRERRAPHIMLATVVLFFAAFIAWAAYFEIEEVTRGDGRVITQSQTQVITNLEGGIIAEILVSEGDIVKKGEPLIRIDPTRFEAAFREGEQSALALKARIARLRAEARGSAFSMPVEVTKGSPTIAQQEAALYRSRQAELATKTQVLRQQLVQRESELKELTSRSQRLAEQLVLVDRELAITAPLVKKGVVSEVELLRLEREQTRTRTELEQARLAIPRAQAAIAEARGRLADNEAAFRAQAGGELAVAQAELAKVAEQIPALEDRATRTIVRAAMDGVVKAIPNKTIGGVVQPGSPMIEMVPVEDNLLIETRIRPADIAFVRVGQRAVVKVTAYDFSIFGGLEGKVEHVAADSVVPQQGEPYYIAHVRTASNAIMYHDKKLSISPGMLASVDIITGMRSVLYYLLKPINRARERAMTER